MVARLICGAIQGVDAFRVDLEVDLLRKGLPAFVMVGLAEGAVRGSPSISLRPIDARAGAGTICPWPWAC